MNEICIIIQARGNKVTEYLVCKCGWKSRPHSNNTPFIGLGGQLSCPRCTKLRRNPNIEVYGSIEIIYVPDEMNPSKRKEKNLESNHPEFICDFLSRATNWKLCEKCRFKQSISRCYWKTESKQEILEMKKVGIMEKRIRIALQNYKKNGNLLPLLLDLTDAADSHIHYQWQADSFRKKLKEVYLEMIEDCNPSSRR